MAKFPIAELDDKRQIADEDKIAIFATKKLVNFATVTLKIIKMRNIITKKDTQMVEEVKLKTS